ncbi:MAG TPA: hypothetical protein VFQ44_01980 [Streptosporangiaceae bacterium]|nr:hypothetical protein [Streptosporangiaceae bacterium]
MCRSMRQSWREWTQETPLYVQRAWWDFEQIRIENVNKDRQ